MTVHKCSHCSKEYKYESEKRRHESSHFPQFQCKVCSKSFSFISALRRHEKQHERTGMVTCGECGKEFRDEILLKRHIKYAHAGSFTCTKCGSIFNSEPALHTHMQTHKSESEKRYQCSYKGCTKKFNFPHHLKHHELTHSNTKQHFCKICGKGFIQSHHLKTHLRTHNDHPSLNCTYTDCNRKFATMYAKKRHIATYHRKTDSGISSDSNSACDTSIPTGLKNTDYDDNMSPYPVSMLSKDELTTSTFTHQELYQNLTEDLSISNIDYTEAQFIDNIDNDNNNEITDCKSAVGSCIMRDEKEKCVCLQITKPDIHDYDLSLTETDNIKFKDLSINCSNNCDVECCSRGCGSDNSVTNDIIPEIEYTNGGIVKIKEFFNMDKVTDETFKVNDNNEKNYNKFIPFNSCKSVLGNCIVSGNSTIGDGCLCAKMAIDDQATAQEIEDITPHPRNEQSFVF